MNPLVEIAPVVLIVFVAWLIKSRVRRVDDDRGQIDPHPLPLLLSVAGAFVLLNIAIAGIGLVPVVLGVLTGIVLVVHHNLQPPEEKR